MMQQKTRFSALLLYCAKGEKPETPHVLPSHGDDKAVARRGNEEWLR